MTELTTELQRGSELAGYRIEAVLGRGGMGVVYLAEQLRLKRRVALKLLAPELAADERFRERFLRESELAASLDHPNVVDIYDAGEADGLLYLAMRWVEGSDLGTLLAREGRLDPQRAMAIVGPVADALDAGHALGLVHRDVKPGNVLLAENGTVYLADFGLTRSAGEGSPEGKPHLSGTLEYVAPEQIDGEPPDPRADVYALGCVLYHCLAGEPPFARDSQMALLWAHFNEQPPSLHQHRPELPEAIDPVIAKALAKDPGERYTSGSELAAAAAQALGVGLPAPRMSRRRLLILAAGGALGIAAAATVPSILLTRRSTDDNPAKPTTVITRDTLQRIDPETNELVATIPYGKSGIKDDWYGDLAVGEGAVWVIDRRAQTVDRIDASTNTVSGTTPLPIPDSALSAQIGVGLGAVWIVTTAPWVARIDPGSGLVTDHIPMPGDLRATWLDSGLDSVRLGSVWVGADDHSKWRINPETREATLVARYEGTSGLWEGSGYRPTPQPDVPAGELGWFGGDPGIAVFDLATAKRVANFPGWFFSPQWLIDKESAWIPAWLDGTVWQLDAGKSQVVRRIPVGKRPKGIAFGEGSIWVANSGDGTVSRIDPASGTVVKTIEVGGSPQSVAVGEGGVWVTVYPA